MNEPRRSPSRGAWIETRSGISPTIYRRVAPPRGERGLKQKGSNNVQATLTVAPPRGERGLKRSPVPAGIRPA